MPEIGINPDYDCLLDPQMAAPVAFCEKCGGEIYAEGHRLCADCREEYHD